ncbi:MAG: hypothetical protein U0169_01990 [Polyangiaceae bacterium]
MRRMDATPDQLRSLVVVLREEGRDELLEELLFHPDVPEDVLLALCEEGAFLGSLGHRRGPRALLERMAELHAYPEAIVSLGLQLYRNPDSTSAEFEAFTRRHGHDAWMVRSLAESDGSDPVKEAIYEGLLGGFPEATAFHARHLALSPGVSSDRLTAFLDRHDAPDLWVLLLATDFADEARRVLVETRAEKSADRPEVAAALHRVRSSREARSDDLGPERASELLASGDATVLLALAGNPRTPREILESFARAKSVPHARRLRELALANPSLRDDDVSAGRGGSRTTSRSRPTRG